MVAKKTKVPQEQPQDSEQIQGREQEEPDHEEKGFQEDNQYFHGTEFHRWVGR